MAIAAATGLCWPSSSISRISSISQLRTDPIFFFRTSSSSPQLLHRRSPSVRGGIVRTSASSGDGTPLIEEPEEAQAQEDPNHVIKKRMQALADAMELPANFLAQLPNDLRNDLKDAAFSLVNGPVQRECGEMAGEKLLQLSQAWEKGDTQACALATKELGYVLPREPAARAAVGRRLINAGRRFAGTGVYAEGELQKIAKALTAAGETLNIADSFSPTEEPLSPFKRTYKFGDLQIELTSQKCYAGCLAALGFGGLSWNLASSLQNIPESTLQFSNGNATLLATSLRGTLLTLGYGSTILSALTLVGLLALGIQLSTEGSNDN